MQQTFNKNNITLTKAGETFNVYDRIQEGRKDTEIYPTLEKYGCLPTAMTNEDALEYLKSNVSEFSQKFDLRDVQQMNLKAQEIFYKLPLEIRNKFDNDIGRFAKEGEKFTKNYIKEQEAIEKAKQEAIKQDNTGVTNNDIS